jgi:hypothetical protein
MTRKDGENTAATMDGVNAAGQRELCRWDGRRGTGEGERERKRQRWNDRNKEARVALLFCFFIKQTLN